VEQIFSDFLNLNLLWQTILAVFAGSFLVQIFYYIFFYFRVFTFKKQNSATHSDIPLSVIICARNEGNNLKGFLHKVLEQDYPKFEVIVVDDASEDHTNSVLNEYKKKYKHLYVTHIEKNTKFSHGKKLALTIGIKAAKYHHMVFTDADCRPDSDKWLQAIADSYEENTQLVLGYGGYLHKKGLLNKLIRFDTLFIALQYMSFAKAGIPYMGIGRNLSYAKDLYESVKGFSSHYHILSGDDDLFVNQTANKKNTSVCAAKASIVRSVPKRRISELIHQKRRHLSTGKYYKFKHKLLLSGEVLSRMLFYLTFGLVLSANIFTWVVTCLFIFRMLCQYLSIGKAGQLFNEKDLRIFIIFFDIFIPLLNIWTVLSKYFIKNKINQRW
jgi:glycosyltransferase involved in cell wall biosynthesis